MIRGPQITIIAHGARVRREQNGSAAGQNPPRCYTEEDRQ